MAHPGPALRLDPGSAPAGKPPLASDLARSVSQLRGALSAGVVHPDPELSPARKGKRQEPWPELPALRALETGVPLGVVLHQGIRTALHRSLVQGSRAPVRAALAADPAELPVGWYEELCVVAERPELAGTEPVPGTWHEEVRLRPDGLRYRDGWRPRPG
ncbi:MAG TPA: hypothetical protein VGD91_08455 [Trebonia sp.]